MQKQISIFLYKHVLIYMPFYNNLQHVAKCISLHVYTPVIFCDNLFWTVLCNIHIQCSDTVKLYFCVMFSG
jgi:hypothetical protein